MLILSIVLIAHFVLPLRTQDISENKIILERLLNNNDTEVTIAAMSYINDEVVIFLSSVHLYRSPSSDLFASNLFFKMKLYPGRLYDYRGANVDFTKLFCFDDGSCKGAKRRRVILYKITKNDLPIHCIGVVNASKIEDKFALHSFNLKNMKKMDIVDPFSSKVIGPIYRPMDDPISFSFLLSSYVRPCFV